MFLHRNRQTTDGDGTPVSRKTSLYCRSNWRFLTCVPTDADDACSGGTHNVGNEPFGANSTYQQSMQDLSMPDVAKTIWHGNPRPRTKRPPALRRIRPMGTTVGNASDLLLTDVISFDVRVLAGFVGVTGVITRDTDFRDLSGLQNFNTGANPAFPAGGTPFVFDTWSNQTDAGNPANTYTAWNTTPGLTAIPLFQNASIRTSIIIQAIQITLRVWDFKMKKTRQVTIVQQM